MLYVSRSFGSSCYGVVDTDDDVEETVEWVELCNAVLKHGLDIKGVQLGHNAIGAFVSSVIPYQDIRYYSQAQVKAKTLLGVDVRTYKGEITRIVADGNITPDCVRIRLSEFGNRITRSTGIHWFNNEYRKKLILVLDDNIDIVDLTPSLCITGVTFDVSDITDEEFVTFCYKEMMAMVSVMGIDWSAYLMDSPERSAIWHQLNLLEKAADDVEKYQQVLADIPDKQAMADHIRKVYKYDFDALSRDKIDANAFVSLYIDNFTQVVKANENRYPFKLEDYDYLRGSFIDVFRLLRVASGLHYDTLKRMENYIAFFDVADDIKEIYIRFCNSMTEAILNYWSKATIPFDDETEDEDEGEEELCYT